MILFEFIVFIIKKLIRFCIWVITARDCKHCRYRYENILFGSGCRLDGERCEESLYRCYFERKNKEGICEKGVRDENTI